MSFCSLSFCHMRQSCCFCLSEWSSMLHCVCFAFLEGSLACINLCHGWRALRMLFQMRSMSSVAAFTPVSSGQVLAWCIFWLHLLFLSLLLHRGLTCSSGINTKGLFCIVTFSSFVSSAQGTGAFFSSCVIIESIKKPGPLSQIILLSAQPLCKVSCAYHNSYASFRHLQLN